MSINDQSNDYAERMRDHLEDQCDRLDRGEGLSRGNWASVCWPAVLPAVMGLSVGCIGCAYGMYGGPWDDEGCRYTKDDAGKLVPRCDDPNCSGEPECEEDSDAG